ncbi:MAG: tyrosine-type recombinase/integrase [Candidatus Lambdaproteobacteria bacterium]|nr:tyrosine-type recombinase/integrase [Candidatus Lambdaproteobacteria bacterium]
MRKNPAVLTEEQTNSLMQGTWGRSQERDRWMMIFLLNTGLKINEFVNLNVGDVYTGLRVKKNLLIASAPGKPQRAVPLTREGREAIAYVLEFNRSQGFMLGAEEPFIISRQRNKKDQSYRMTPRQVQRIVKTLREDAALQQKTTPQTLRHTYAKTLLGKGVDMKTVQKLLGHRSIKTTRNLYGLGD